MMATASVNAAAAASDGSFRKRKKKKSFLQRAKKFGRSGRFGQGREIDRETYDYFVRVLEQINRGFDEEDGEDEDQKQQQELFVSNVFNQTLNHEVELSGNQLVSRVLERLLPLADAQVQARFMTSLADDLRLAATDPFASHVLELLLLLATFQEAKLDEATNFRKTWVLRVSKFMINNFDDFCFDPYASHLLRTCFQCLAGTKLDESVTRSRRSRHQKQNCSQLRVNDDSLEFLAKSPVSRIRCGGDDDEAFGQVLSAAVEKVVGYEKADELASADTASGVVQTLVLVLDGDPGTKSHCRKLCLHLIDRIFRSGRDRDTEDDDVVGLDPVLHSEPGCRILESMLAICNDAPGVLDKIVSEVVRDGRSVVQLALHPVANFVLQKLLAHCNDKELFEKWYQRDLDGCLEEILAAGNSGVVLAVARTCRRLNAKQSHFLVALMKCLHCHEPSHLQGQLANLLVHLSTREESEEEGRPAAVSLHGTLILQELLNFNKPAKVVGSLLEMARDKLSAILNDPRGCHVADAFMKSKTLGEKSRDGLIKALQGRLTSMACSKHGSRSIDALWLDASKKGKEWMARELSADEPRLTSDQFGRFVAQKLLLSTFGRSRDEWRRALDGRQKNEELAAEFLGSLNVKRPSGSEVEAATKRARSATDARGDNGVLATEDVASKKGKKKSKKSSYLDDL